METTKPITTRLPSTLPVARLRVSATHWSLALSAGPVATCIAAGGSGSAGGNTLVARAEVNRRAHQVLTQGLRAQLQGTSGFGVQDYPTMAEKPVGGVRGVPPRGRPV